MDYQQVISGIDNYENWRYQVAEKWKDWVKLCLFARIQDIGCECTYSNLSKINQPLYGQLDSTVYAKYLHILKVRSKLLEEQFAKAFEKVSNQVDDLYAAGEYDRVFKGKWYAGFLEAEIKIIAGNHHFHSKTLAVRIITALTMTLNFETNWVEYFNKPLRELVEKF